MINRYIQLLVKEFNLDEARLLELWNQLEPEIDYSKKTLTELKQLCKEKGLKMSGTKQALIERLQNPIPVGTETTVVSVSKVKKTEGKKAVKKVSSVLQMLLQNTNVLNIRRNVYGHYEHADTGFIFDEKTQEVIGKQSETNSPTINPLTEDDIEVCRELNFKYRIPDTIETSDLISSLPVDGTEVTEFGDIQLSGTDILIEDISHELNN